MVLLLREDGCLSAELVIYVRASYRSRKMTVSVFGVDDPIIHWISLIPPLLYPERGGPSLSSHRDNDKDVKNQSTVTAFGNVVDLYTFNPRQAVVTSWTSLA